MNFINKSSTRVKMLVTPLLSNHKPFLTEKRLMATTIYHKHHIIPKHIGGTDDPLNLVKLTIKEHAEAHEKLYEEYGRWEDELAWKGLVGLIDKDDLLRLVSKHNKRNTGKKHTLNTIKKISEKRKEYYKTIEGKKWKKELSKIHKGKTISQKQRKQLSEIRKSNGLSKGLNNPFTKIFKIYFVNGDIQILTGELIKFCNNYPMNPGTFKKIVRNNYKFERKTFLEILKIEEVYSSKYIKTPKK